MIGSLGPVIFSVSSLRVLTFNKFKRDIKKRTTKHEVISGKPRTEYLGPYLQTVSFSMRLDITYGVQPKMMIMLLEQMAEQGLAYPLIIGGRPIGFNPWSIDSISVSDDVMYSFGELASAEVTVSLTEYVPMM